LLTQQANSFQNLQELTSSIIIEFDNIKL